MPTIQEMRAAKLRLENEIKASIAEFTKQTGATPSRVDVDIINVRRPCDLEPRYALSHVTVTIEL